MNETTGYFTWVVTSSQLPKNRHWIHVYLSQIEEVYTLQNDRKWSSLICVEMICVMLWSHDTKTSH